MDRMAWQRLSPEQRALAASRLRRQRGDGHEGGAAPARADLPSARRDPDDAEEPPLSFAQEGVWIAQQRDPDSPAYNSVRYLRLDGECDGRSLVAALSDIVRRHGILRTGFTTVEGRPVQRVRPFTGLEVPCVDLQALPVDGGERVAQRLARALTRRPFRLDHPPLVRLVLCRLACRVHVLLLISHHVIADGRSMTIFLAELAAAYERRRASPHAVAPDPASAEPEPVQFAHYASGQRLRMDGPRLQARIAYWRRVLDGAPPLSTVPADRPRRPVPRFNGRRQRTLVPDELARGVRAAARAHAVTPFMLWLAGLQVVLSHLTGQADIVVGLNLTDRRRDLADTIGFFVATLPIRMRLDPDQAFVQTLRQTRAAVLAAQASQDVSFGHIVEALQPVRVPGANPMFQIVTTWQEVAEAGDAWSTLRVTSREIDAGVTRFDQFLSFEQFPDRLELAVVFDADLYEAATIEREVASLFHLVTAVLAQPDRCLRDLQGSAASSADARARLAAYAAAKFAFEF